jgi:hypothetical protein
VQFHVEEKALSRTGVTYRTSNRVIVTVETKRFTYYTLHLKPSPRSTNVVAMHQINNLWFCFHKQVTLEFMGPYLVSKSLHVYGASSNAARLHVHRMTGHLRRPTYYPLEYYAGLRHTEDEVPSHQQHIGTE